MTDTHPLLSVTQGITDPAVGHRARALAAEVDAALAATQPLPDAEDAAVDVLRRAACRLDEAGRVIVTAGGPMAVAVRWREAEYRALHRRAVARLGPGQSIVPAIHAPWT